MNELPQIGEFVVVRELDGQSYASRVEDDGGGVLSVTLPAELLAAQTYEVGSEFDLAWTKPSGIHVLPVELVEVRTEQRVRLWDLAIVGAGWVEQRREHVRVPVSGPVTLDIGTPGGVQAARAGVAEPFEPAEGGGPLRGHLIDLSEAAMQCAVHLSADEPRPVADAAVTCRFALNEDEFAIPGVVVSVRGGSAPQDARVVVHFEQSESGTDALRRQVFAIQLQMRRTRRR